MLREGALRKYSKRVLLEIARGECSHRVSEGVLLKSTFGKVLADTKVIFQSAVKKYSELSKLRKSASGSDFFVKLRKVSVSVLLDNPLSS